MHGREESIVTRYEAAELTGERSKKIRETLIGFIEKYYRGNEETFKNLRLGFVQGAFETVISRSSIFFYLQFEAYVGEQWGESVAIYFSHMIFRGVYDYLWQNGALGNMPISDIDAKKRKIRQITNMKVASDLQAVEGPLKQMMIAKLMAEKPKKWTAEENYHHFFYGHNAFVGGNRKWRITFFECALSRWLHGDDEDFKRLLGVALAEYTELAVMSIIDDVATNSIRKWEDVEMEDDLRAGFVYGVLKQQMVEADKHLIGIGENPVFRLPQFGI